MITSEPESQGRLYFIMFSNLLTSYYRPKEEKYSKVRKLHKTVVSSFVSCFPAEILETVLVKLRELLQRFQNKGGSLVAVYSHEFLMEVVEINSQAKLTEPEDPLLMSDWEGVLGFEVFDQENDQFLISDLIDFAYNLITVAESETDSMVDLNKFDVSNGWVELLIEMILEPSLSFSIEITEKLLEKICGDQHLFYSNLYDAKIHKSFSIIAAASQRNNFFKNFSYIESIFLLKELMAIKENIKKSDVV